ncbi:MAG: S8 family serine peptidase [Candidatus Aenigmarchaeota archaeon]|nr:S8 family serine peptidase [Candidatus Aenigmarchaeota archaeon]
MEINKTKLTVLFAMVLLVISGIVMAQGEKVDDKVRVIAPTTSFIDKIIFRMNGCSIVHELNDATALKCPAGIAKKLNVREDRIFHIVDLEADEQIGADRVWDELNIEGTGVNVAVLDTGIDMNHPELDDCYISGYDYVDEDSIPEDWHGHGTHVSGIITADGVNPDAKGVAPGAGIYMYKVCGTYGCYESDMMRAMEATVQTDAKVMSISIGGGNFAGENCDSDPLAAKVNWVVSNGITVVVASGNDRFFVSSPACASGAIAVGATDKTGLMASFSNFGPALDIVAPGVNIYSSVIDGYASWGGTSMSTPHVSGTVALMLEANPSLTVDEIKTALYETADLINPDSICYGVIQRGRNYFRTVVPCSSDNYGAGIINAYGAVNYYTPIITCSSDAECDDTNECTTDTCMNPGETSSYCENTAVADDTPCTGGVCCGGICSAATCTDDLNCDDTNECTIDTCYFGGTCSAYCGYTNLADDTTCTDGICCSGSCSTPTCSADDDCGDAEICTTDTCIDAGTCSASCSNTWPSCSLTSDGCCGPECTSDTDVDCVVSVVCGDDICAGNFEGQLNGEDCNTCPEDCPSRTTGRPSGRYCCGDGACDPAENPEICPIDCL